MHFFYILFLLWFSPKKDLWNAKKFYFVAFYCFILATAKPRGGVLYHIPSI